jgi:hypothetical protein
MNAEGHCAVVLLTTPASVIELELDKKVVDSIRNAVRAEKFFELNDRYGQLSLDSSTITMAITMGSVTKVVRIADLGAYQMDPGEAAEVARAANVYSEIRGTFNDARAMDHREFFKELLAKNE